MSLDTPIAQSSSPTGEWLPETRCSRMGCACRMPSMASSRVATKSLSVCLRIQTCCPVRRKCDRQSSASLERRSSIFCGHAGSSGHGPDPKWPAHFREVWRGEGCVVAENPHAAPRVYLTTQAFDFEKKGEELLTRPRSGTRLGCRREDLAPLAKPMTKPGRVGITGPFVGRGRAGDGELVVTTQTNGEAYLVVLDTLLPGVKATLDGVPCPILPAFAAFRCVRVPAGRHEIAFRYEPRGTTLAAWTEAFLWLFALLWLIGQFARRRAA